MENTLPYQPRFKIHVKGKDITEFVDGGVEVNYELMRIANATFTILKEGETFSDVISRGNHVTIWGGYTKESELYNDGTSTSANHYGMVFNGHIRSLTVNYLDNGSVTLTVTCIDRSWSISGFSEQIYRYPGKGNKREWANTSRIKISEIIKNLVDDMGVDLDFNMGDVPDREFTLKDPFCQQNETDFALLNRLAVQAGCYVWFDTVLKDGEQIPTPVLHFKSRKTIVENKGVTIDGGRPEFVWIGRNGMKFIPEEAHKGSYGITGQKEMLAPNQIKLLTATVTEDPLVYGTPVSKIQDFDEITGETVEKYVTYDEDNGDIIYYELDQPKIDELMKTEGGRATADKLQNFGAFDIPWENPNNPELAAKTYFKEKRISKDIIDAIDHPVYGVTVNATCYGDLRIRPHQSYRILGINKYGKPQTKLKFYLKTMTHTWDENGFITSMEFRA